MVLVRTPRAPSNPWFRTTPGERRDIHSGRPATPRDDPSGVWVWFFPGDGPTPTAVSATWGFCPDLPSDLTCTFLQSGTVVAPVSFLRLSLLSASGPSLPPRARPVTGPGPKEATGDGDQFQVREVSREDPRNRSGRLRGPRRFPCARTGRCSPGHGPQPRASRGPRPRRVCAGVPSQARPAFGVPASPRGPFRLPSPLFPASPRPRQAGPSLTSGPSPRRRPGPSLTRRRRGPGGPRAGRGEPALGSGVAAGPWSGAAAVDAAPPRARVSAQGRVGGGGRGRRQAVGHVAGGGDGGGRVDASLRGPRFVPDPVATPPFRATRALPRVFR